MRKFLIPFLFFSLSAMGDVAVRRGVAIDGSTKSTALAAVFVHPTAYMNGPIVTEGVVADVCRWAGCWMTVVAPEATGPSMRVTFNGFTVPRSFRGRRARIVGRVKVIGNKPSFVAEGIEILGMAP